MWYEIAYADGRDEPERPTAGDEWLEHVARWAEPWRVSAADRQVRRETRKVLSRREPTTGACLDALRGADRDRVVAIWQAVTAGEWSLVDHFDVAGLRFVVARRDRDAPKHRLDELTPCERRVVECAARGYTNKLIAYELNLSPSAVGMRLARAARKWRAASRVELIVAYRRARAIHP